MSQRKLGRYELRRRATPKWAEEEKIEAIYREARKMTRITGIKHHVDHVLPLAGLDVCGLHVAPNLQIITRKENSVKQNKPPSAELDQKLKAVREFELRKSLYLYETSNLDVEEDDSSHPLSALYRDRGAARLDEVKAWLVKRQANKN